MVHARSDDQAEAAIVAVTDAYAIGPSKPPAEKAIIRRIAAS
jgi:thymidine phosphorylase